MRKRLPACELKGLHLMVTSECNENCLFCAKAGYEFTQLDIRQCLSVLVNKRREGFNCLVLDGGEPGLRADLHLLLLAALKLDYQCLEISTNATAFSSPAVMKKFKKIKSRDRQKISFAVSLHAHKASVSDKLTGLKGGFSKTITGMENITAAHFDLGVYHIITEQNYKDLPAYALFLRKRFPQVRGVVFSFIFPSGNALQHKEIYPKVSLVMPHLLRAVEILRQDGRLVSLSACGMIPVCMMKGLEMLFVQSYEGANAANTQVVDSQKTEDFLFHEGKLVLDRKLKAKSCAACAVNPICGGIWAIYAAKYGLKELQPLKFVEPLPFSSQTLRQPFCADAAEPLNSVLVQLYKARLNNREPVFSEKTRQRADFCEIEKFHAAISGQKIPKH